VFCPRREVFGQEGGAHPPGNGQNGEFGGRNRKMLAKVRKPGKIEELAKMKR
jgi:hypothetical protein